MNPVSDESRLTAYALDELNATDRAAVERELAEHPELRAEVEQIRALAATLTRELDREDGVALDEVRREAIHKAAQTPARTAGRRPFAFGPWLGAAAALLLTVTMLTQLPRETRKDEGETAAAAVLKTPQAKAPAQPVEPVPPRGNNEQMVPLESKIQYPKPIKIGTPVPITGVRNLEPDPSVGTPGIKWYPDLRHQLEAPPIVKTEYDDLDQTKDQKNLSHDVVSPMVVSSTNPAPPEPPGDKIVGNHRQNLISEAERLLAAAGPMRGRTSAMRGPGNKANEGRDESNTRIISPSLDDFPERTDQPFLRVGDHPLSTFSVDVDTASYSVVRKMLTEGRLPPPDAVRVEEMINYFTYEAAPPQDGKAFAAHLEMMPAPWNTRHPLVRITLKGRELTQATRPALNLVYLVDVSGSMDAPNKLPLVKRALQMLAAQLEDKDHIAMVVYAGSSGLVLPATNGSRQREIVEALDRLNAGGSTAGGAGIQLAYQVAREHFQQGAENRVILCTDGDFNVGLTQRGDLERLIEKEAKSGVFLSVLGFGMGNYKDSTLELLSGKGNGNYAYIDTFAEARKVLVDQMFGTLVTIAKDVKVQVEFNPARVAGYRLIGYENRMLRKEDFNNDKIDAGDIGAGHTVTALYELVPAGQSVTDAPAVDPLKYQKSAEAAASTATQEWLTVKLRHKAPDGDVSSLQEFPLPADAGERGEPTRDFRFAAAVAAFGQRLRGTTHLGSYSYDQILALAEPARGDDPLGYRAEFLKLVRNAKALAGNAPKGAQGDLKDPNDIQVVLPE
ncbi:MAG: von Willebrand factor type A domain-containing protein [Kiritimatiellia bacterium]